MKILLTGATGYIGKRLLPRLIAQGHELFCCVRDRSRFTAPPGMQGAVQVLEVDFLHRPSLDVIPQGIDCAYYLVHGMGSAHPGWAEEELRWARDFARVAGQAGVRRIIYLGGVAPQGSPSEHLLSRLQTGETLRSGPVPCLELRAGMIIGAGSTSWTIVRDLAARLPAMVLPAWLAHRSSPVALDDVLAALQAGLRLELPASTWWDIPGPEALSGTEILLRVAAVLGRRPLLLKVPLVTPRLSSHWIRLVTRADYTVARELVEGLTSDLVATQPGFWEAAGLAPPMALEVAARRALEAEAGTMSRAGMLAESLAGWLTPQTRNQGPE